jgi:vacuolar-type H+-ATPase subunit E/Vma4
MKTALQEFIDNVIPMHIIELDMIKKEIKKALEKEKEQIKKAFEFGVADAYNFIEDEAEQYYNQTYNQNK